MPRMTKDQYAAFAASMKNACAAFEAGEPGADDKMDEAMSAYAAEMPPPEAAGAGAPAPEGLPAPEGEPAVPAEAQYGAIASNFAADPEGAFSALTDLSRRQSAQIAELLTVARGQAGRIARQEFSSYADGLRKAGHLLPDEKSLERQFESCFGSGNPAKSVSDLKDFLKSLPRQALSEDRPAFAAGDTGPARAAPKSKATPAKEIAQMIGMSNFTAEDIKLGAAMAAAINEGL